MVELLEATKRCSECGEEKPLSEFNKLARSADGHQVRCRSCFSEYNRARYAADRERFKAAIYAYRGENPHKVLETRLGVCAKDPTHRNAYRAVEAALIAGVLVRPDHCWGCNTYDPDPGPGHITAHHHDYTEPLDVIWLCSKCHHALHAAIRRREA